VLALVLAIVVEFRTVMTILVNSPALSKHLDFAR
jgi:hypothetical protein